jgi:D-alanyl-lipoteichoic acid acyltransferase DltB (MBOAT superfamily)
MLFNSFDFALFVPTVFIIYWFVVAKSLKLQNLLVLVSSYFFYAWWDWRFLFLLIFSSLVDFLLGQKIFQTNNFRKKKGLLLISIFANIGLLGVFKYYDFFIESFSNAFMLFGKHIELQSLNWILPIGISFYTFQTLSYTIDIYKGKLEPTKNIIAFFCFVSFFPQLVAGPIERASNLLPQFFKKRVFDYNKAVDGSKQILWGLFKKIVIADGCAKYVNVIFNESGESSGSTLFLVAILFSFQIYGDFSGYSDIAIGTAKLFGFEFKQNFAYPYFSRNIGEFWRRWHISLSTWFRDYVYIPLGGNNGSRWLKFRNVFIVFLVSGLWHGANWTFIFWALLHILFFLPLLYFNKNRKYLGKISEHKVIPDVKNIVSMMFTFTLVTFAWIFFRADSIYLATEYIYGIFSMSFFSLPQFITEEKMLIILFFILFQMFMEWKGRNHSHTLELFGLHTSKYFRYFFYYSLIMIIFLFGSKQQEFIYFQF